MKRPDLWLSYAFNKSMGSWIAIASSKHPDLGDDEVDVVEWLPVAEAVDRLSYAHDAEVLRAALT